MQILDHTIISDDLISAYFCCDLKECKGACCVEGDAGAPLDEEEISQLEDNLEAILPHMRESGIRVVKEHGVFDYDAEGNFVTPLVNDRECAFVYFEEGIARCAIEKAHVSGNIPSGKPISCHLYPVRIKRLSTGGEGLNYHKWSICRKAKEKGYQEKIRLIHFLEQALIRKFGRSWYNRLLKLMM
jgi:hypothetical protein